MSLHTDGTGLFIGQRSLLTTNEPFSSERSFFLGPNGHHPQPPLVQDRVTETGGGELHRPVGHTSRGLRVDGSSDVQGRKDGGTEPTRQGSTGREVEGSSLVYPRPQWTVGSSDARGTSTGPSQNRYRGVLRGLSDRVVRRYIPCT